MTIAEIVAAWLDDKRPRYSSEQIVDVVTYWASLARAERLMLEARWAAHEGFYR